VAVTLLLGGPTFGVVAALGIRTFPGAGVCLFVLGQIARALEDLVAVRTLLIDVHGRSILLSAGHRTLNSLISSTIDGDGTFDRSRDIDLARLSRR
jgi:hypothetical protein